MNLTGCGAAGLIARAVLVMLFAYSACYSAIVVDPASRSGVWEATETIDGGTIHFSLERRAVYRRYRENRHIRTEGHHGNVILHINDNLSSPAGRFGRSDLQCA